MYTKGVLMNPIGDTVFSFHNRPLFEVIIYPAMKIEYGPYTICILYLTFMKDPPNHNI